VRTALREIDRFTLGRLPDDPRGPLRTSLAPGPPLHAERHGRLAAALAPRVVEEHAPELAATATRLVEEAAAAPAVEAVTAIAEPLAVVAFGWMLGLDAHAFRAVHDWSRTANAIDDLADERDAAVERLGALAAELARGVRAATAGQLGAALHDWDVTDEELTGDLGGIIASAPANTAGVLAQLLHQLALRPALFASLRTPAGPRLADHRRDAALRGRRQLRPALGRPRYRTRGRVHRRGPAAAARAGRRQPRRGRHPQPGRVRGHA
jgi:cytochrome P450